MIDFIHITLLYVSPILTAAAGGMICERAGVKNIALEGLMITGAMTAAVTHVLLETQTGFSIPLALILAALAGGLLSLIYAFACVTLKANQLICGMGINFLSAGLTVFICQIVFRMDRSMSFRPGLEPFFFGINPGVLIAAAALALCWKLRLRRRLILGKPPCSLRYIAVLISGFLAGLAGACVVLALDTQFSLNTINGKGFIALGIVYTGRRFNFCGLRRGSSKEYLDGANNWQ